MNNNARALSLTAPTVTSFGPSGRRSRLLSAPLSFELETEGTSVRFSWNEPDVGTPNGYTVEVGTDEGLANVARFVVGAT